MKVSPRDLRAIALFSDLDDRELEAVGRCVTARDYSSNEIIFAQEDPSPGLWFIRSGRVRLYRASPSGRELTLCIARADKLPCLGMCPLFDGASCPAFAQALEPTTIYFIDRSDSLNLAQGSPAIARVMASVLSNHFRHLTRFASGLALYCSTPRLADLLLTCAQERGRATARGIELDLDLTRELVSTLLGATPQRVAQDLARLEQEGILAAKGKHLVIFSVDRLADHASKM